MTRPAPASKCRDAPSRERNSPVHSSTTSTPNPSHGNWAGSAIFKISIEQLTPCLVTFKKVRDGNVRVCCITSTLALNRPCVLSKRSKCASNSGSAISLIATIFTCGHNDSSIHARNTLRPIRPKPLMAMFKAVEFNDTGWLSTKFVTHLSISHFSNSTFQDNALCTCCVAMQ